MNREVHPKLKMAPISVNKKTESEAWFNSYRSLVEAEPPKAKLLLGSLVRIAKNKIIFSKAYDQSFSKEIFKVSKIRHTKPVITYKLVDSNNEEIASHFYFEELQLVSSEKPTDE